MTTQTTSRIESRLTAIAQEQIDLGSSAADAKVFALGSLWASANPGKRFASMADAFQAMTEHLAARMAA
jgi:hypothetical protein